MSTLNFPDPSASPWTAPNGVTYIWDTDGEFWDGSASGTNLDQDFLKLNATNSPVTGDLQLTKTLTVNQSLTVDQGAQVNSLTVDQNAEVSGNVGIGISDPQKKLDISGDVRIANGQLELPGGGGNTDALQKQEVQGLIDSIDDYVEISGDNMTGDLTLGTNQITLDAANGSATFAGDVTANSFLGDGSNLSGIESGTANFVASGTIPNGAPVVINSDGTVSVITETGSENPNTLNTATFDGCLLPTQITSTVYDSENNKIVIAYVGQTSLDKNLKVVLGTVSGSTISFGTPYYLTNNVASPGIRFVSSTYDSTNKKIVIAYQFGSSYALARVGEIVGDTINFGSAAQFSSSNPPSSSATTMTFDSTNSKVIIAYEFSAGGDNGAVVVGTVNGLEISFGPVNIFESSTITDLAVTYDSNTGKVVFAYYNSSVGKSLAKVGNVSGTSISFGNAVQFGDYTNKRSIAFDSSNNKIVIFYKDVTNALVKTIVGSVSGTSISFGSEITYSTGTISSSSMTYDSTNSKVVVAYTMSGTQSAYVMAGTVSGTTISYGNYYLYSPSYVSMVSTAYDVTNQKVVVAYNSSRGGISGSASLIDPVYRSSNLTNQNFIGFAAEAITSGTSGKINIMGGVNSSQTGLTSGNKYYVRNDGSLSLNPIDQDIVAGTTVSSTKIIVKG